MDLVEHVGSGLKRIRGAMKEYGLEAPVIEADEHWFAITFKRKTALKGPEKGMEKGSASREKTREKIFAIIMANTRITMNELAEKTGLSIKGIEKNMRLLKQENVLKRVGPDKGGHWEVQ